MRNIFYLTGLVLLLIFSWSGTYGEDKQIAYKERIITPHWEWVKKHKGGTVKALFLVNNLATREPYELQQRFDISATVVPVSGDAYKNYYDEKFFLEEIEKNYDVIVVASTKPWGSLSSSTMEKIKEKVVNGCSLVIFGVQPEIFSELKSVAEEEKTIIDIEKKLPVKNLKFKIPFKINVYKAKKGKIVLVNGYDLHWCFFTSFLPINTPYFEGCIEPELFYALAAKIIRYAANKESDLKIEEVIIPEEFVLGDRCKFRLKVSKERKIDTNLIIEIYGPSGNLLGNKVISIEKGENEIEDYFKPFQAGRLIVVFKLEEQNQTLDFAALSINVISPANFADIDAPEKIRMDEKLNVKWTINGEINNSYQVHCQVYDAIGNLVSFAEANASEKNVEMKEWIPEFISHKLRILLVNGEQILDEIWKPIQVQLDRKDDTKRYQVILWSMEYGSFVERFRYQIFKNLGIDALATPNQTVLKMASEEGLRMVPTNIYVPPNMYKLKFDKEEEEKKLESYAQNVYKYNPLGYSLADEPSEEGIKELKMRDLCDFRDWAAEIIHRYDHEAKVGYCGVWWGMDKNVPQFFSHCDFVEGYSPFFLYTPNLWLGMERDLYRSFIRTDSILTCWTHYIPRADLEPYSRTVPWLWLFEGMNGVSYFASAGEYGILTNDWQTTHETRWWSEEIKEIKKGIGEQIIKMDRDIGAVRILFHPSKDENVGNWATALNRINIPYKYISHKELKEGLGKEVKLVICPDVREISDVELENLQKFIQKGGWVFVTGAFGILEGDKIVEKEGVKNLLGIVQINREEEIKEWGKDMSLHGGIPVKVKLTEKDILSLDTDILTGFTTGIHSIEEEETNTLGKFIMVGEANEQEKKSQPEYIQQIFSTPAILIKNFGKGKVIYFTFHPDIETIKLLILGTSNNIGLNNNISCKIDGKQDDTVYLYPFKRGNISLVGVIQDYWRIHPTFQIEGHKSDFNAWASVGGEETVQYFYHGPYLWDEKDCVLNIKENRHIYDVRKGIYKGFSTQVKFKIKPGRPELFAFLPYEITNLNIILPSEINQGEILNIEIELKGKNDSEPGDHVVHIELTYPNGRQHLNFNYNVHTKKGNGSISIFIPFNVTPGKWFLIAKDSITGISVQKEILIKKSRTQPKFIFNKEYTKIEHVPLDWTEGKWVAYKKGEDSKPSDVKVNIQPLARTRMYIAKEHAGHEYLTGGFTLTNSQISYQICYSVCNDWKVHKWEDERKVWAPYLPGLGIVKPQPHIWYYNGYIHVFLDDFDATAYRISEIKQIESGKNGRVDVIWDSPKGEITLSFLMCPDHSGLFQKLTVKPNIPVKKLTLQFSSYPDSFTSPNKPFVFMEPEEKRWCILGDEINDRAFGKGRGPGGILLLPEELDSIKYRPYNTELEKIINIQPNQEISIHWTIWLFPEMSNKRAIEYMNKNADDTERRLKEYYNIP